MRPPQIVAVVLALVSVAVLAMVAVNSPAEKEGSSPLPEQKTASAVEKTGRTPDGKGARSVQSVYIYEPGIKRVKQVVNVSQGDKDVTQKVNVLGR